MRLTTMELRAAVLGLAVSIGNVHAQDKENPNAKMGALEPYLITDRNAEIAIARSAAPAAISTNATILVRARQERLRLHGGPQLAGAIFRTQLLEP
jgi:hypothetical protein